MLTFALVKQIKRIEVMRKVYVNWDCDEVDIHDANLPYMVEVPENIDDDNVSDWLSDEYGWLVESWYE